MEGISDIKIVGIDKKRPPRVRKAPYIDVFFMLSHQAPKDWCEDFNDLANKLTPPVKIDKVEGVYVEAWVRDMSGIPAHLGDIKKTVAACNKQYIERILRMELDATTENGDSSGAGTEQLRLNAIVAALKFDD